MRSMPRLHEYCVLALVLLAPQVSLGQFSIDTIAGGGPNKLSALNASAGFPQSVAFDTTGNAYIAESYAGQILEVSPSGTVTVVAGNGTNGYSGDGGPATSAALNQPLGVFVDGSGNIFIADSQNSLIREVTASTGTIQTVAGDFPAGAGYSGDGGLAIQAQLDTPEGIYVDASGNIFIADSGNSIVREVTASNNDIQTVAGTPQQFGFFGDGGSPTAAVLDFPTSVFLDSSGNIFISDTFNNVIRVVNPGTLPITVAGTTVPNGEIVTVIGAQYPFELGAPCPAANDGGPALSANLCVPVGIFVDSSEDIFIADNNNFAIREVVAAGTISTVAGTIGSNCTTYLATGCGNGNSATDPTVELNYPNGVFVDSAGDIYIADSEDYVVREVVSSSGDIQAFAGNGFLGYSGDGSLPVNAELNNPGGVFVDGSGNLYVADTDNSVIRFVNNTPSPFTIPGTTNVIQPGDIGTVAGNGTPGYSGDGSLAINASLNSPEGIFVDSAGDIFIADAANNVIREVVASTGNIQTVAGNGTQGFVDNVAPLSAELDDPYAVAVDISGNIFIADTDNDVIRVVNVGTTALTFGPISVPANTILTIAGTPTLDCDSAQAPANCGDGGVATSAYLSSPAGMTLDAQDDVFIADTFDDAIREVSASTDIIQTVAGTTQTPGFSGDNGPATSALLNSPSGVFLDGSTPPDIFIADSDNAAIREVVAATGLIQTVAGIPATAGGLPTPGFSGDGGSATSAELDFPSGLFVNPAGRLFIADTDNSRIRELTPASFTVSVAPSTATVVVGALQQYTATVTGNSNTNVNWFVDGLAGGNSTVGTISTSGLFTAPASVPSPATVTISAVSQADNTTLGSAQATIANGSTTDSITVTPTPVQVYTSAVQPFSAADNGTATAAVTWYVEGAQGGDSTFGTIDTSGNYTAPAAVPSPATITVEAVLQADVTAIGTASVTVVAAPSSSQPAAQTVSPGGMASYSFSISGSKGPTLTLACSQSSLPSGASCSFTPATVTPNGSAQPVTMVVSVPSSSAGLRKEPRPLGQSIYLGFIPLAAILLFGAAPRRRHASMIAIALALICLLAMVACGGSGSSSGTQPLTYTIQIQGKAQSQVVNLTTASLTVQ